MNKFFVAFIVAVLLFSCEYEHGIIEINVSYINNENNKVSDQGAKVFLFDHSKTSDIVIDSMTIADARIGRLSSRNGGYLDLIPLYEGEAESNGKVILNVKSGYYLIILASRGRESFSHKHQYIKNEELLEIDKSFNGFWDNKKGGEVW